MISCHCILNVIVVKKEMMSSLCSGPGRLYHRGPQSVFLFYHFKSIHYNGGGGVDGGIPMSHGDYKIW